jgi:hypothetical protein
VVKCKIGLPDMEDWLVKWNTLLDMSNSAGVLSWSIGQNEWDDVGHFVTNKGNVAFENEQELIC